MSEKFVPLHDRVLVRPDKEQAEKVGDLYIPDVAKEKPQRGTVVAVGAGYYNDNGQFISTTVKIGDTVVFGKYAGSDIKINGEDLTILRENEVYGTILGVIPAEEMRMKDFVGTGPKRK